MRSKNRIIVFALMVMLIVTSVTPVLANDTVANEGALDGNAQVASGDAIDNPTDTAADTTPPPISNEIQDISKKSDEKTTSAARNIKAVEEDDSISGLRISGPTGSFSLNEGPWDGSYFLTVTGGPITISGATSGAVSIYIETYQNASVTFDQVEAPRLGITSNILDTGDVNYNFKGFNNLSLWFGNADSEDSTYKLTGDQNGYIKFERFMQLRNCSYFFENLKITGLFNAVVNYLKFSNIDFDVILNVYDTGSSDYVLGYRNILLAEKGFSFTGCKGKIKYPDQTAYGWKALAGRDFYIMMNTGEELSIEYASETESLLERDSLSVDSNTLCALLIENAPTMVNTTITTPVNGAFKSDTYIPESSDSRLTAYSVFDTKGNIATDVVFTGKADEKKDPPVDNDKDPVEKATQKVLPEEAKTADEMEPWALMTLTILTLIMLLYVSVRRQQTK